MGLDSKIVVLSALDDPAFVTCTFESGGDGYVLKSRMNSDLVFALREVLAGRIFQPGSEVGSKPHLAKH